MATDVGSVLSASTLGPPLVFDSSLTPDALMVYLSTRLNGLDDQINAIFNAQQAQEKVQSALRKVKEALLGLDENTASADMPSEVRDAINAAIDQLPADLAEEVRTRLEQVGGGLIFDHNAGGEVDPTFSGAEVKATKEYIDGLSKDVESESQMNMIKLQSLMSARQTATQLATNLISALGESSKAIAANIGR